MNKYLDGYTVGIVEYCTYDNGYALGLRRGKFLNICPMELRAAYTKGYNQGVFELNENIRSLQSQVDNQENMTRSGGSSSASPTE